MINRTRSIDLKTYREMRFQGLIRMVDQSGNSGFNAKLRNGIHTEISEQTSNTFRFVLRHGIKLTTEIHASFSVGYQAVATSEFWI